MNLQRIGVEVRGLVQGVGFRPFVYRIATRHQLSGWVRNTSEQVELEVQGSPEGVAAFLQDLEFAAPAASRIDSLEVEPREPEPPTPEDAFEIVPSPEAARSRPVLPADLATCDDCIRELRDPADPRFAYPFLNCTHCGPRWSIVRGLPYDRPRTAMAGFPLCSLCEGEYRDPGNRRFHAQPVACPECGPHLSWDGSAPAAGETRSEHDAACLRAAVEALASGKILALQGLGGFQLLVDAGNQEAVETLRQRKRRPSKPFAVMVPDLERARELSHLPEGAAEALTGAEAPIVLLPTRREPGVGGGAGSRGASSGSTDAGVPSPDNAGSWGTSPGIAPAVSPGNPWLGLFLPYTPLHHLLLGAFGRPLICTSGNLSEEPMCIEPVEAREKLGGIADHFLVHDRPIVRPVDDSVTRVRKGRVEVLRRARGFCPRPLELGQEVDGILALGAHLKNTCALGVGTQAVVSPHIGDLDGVASVDLLEGTVRDLLEFFRVRPRRIACDLHPDYASTRLAEELAREFDAELVRVQHHHAHAGACLAEHGGRGPVLALTWDGVGLGSDGMAWGGEALLVEGAECRRLGALRDFPLLGGDRAAREPRRVLLGLVLEALDREPDLGGSHTPGDLEGLFSGGELRVLEQLHARGRSPRTTSMGRLFDGISAACGFPPVVRFEGEAAMLLEFAAGPPETSEPLEPEEAYPLPLGETAGGLRVADWAPLLEAVRTDLARQVPVARVSRGFHAALVELARGWAEEARRVCPELEAVCLTGGCFQNRLLVDSVEARLQEDGFRVLVPSAFPPGDGAISLGQLWVAAGLRRPTG